MEFSFAQATAFVGGFFWPMIRIGAMFLAAPIFGGRQVIPTRVRMGLTLAVTWVIYPLLPPAPAVDPISAAGLMITANQILLGVFMGFTLQLVFSALVIGGHKIAMTMGLGFATFLDPNGVNMPVISNFFSILGTLLFLALNGHLVVIQVLVASFESMPVGAVGLSGDSLMQLVLWGGRMFSGAMLIALPAVITITMINVAFGVMTRAAPQINIFAVLFPTTMAVGYVVIFLTLPTMLPRFTELLMDGFDLMQSVQPAGG